MNEELTNLEQQKKLLEEKLAKLPRKKWAVFKLIFFSIIITFFGPYIPIRKGSLESRMGYHDSVMLFGVIFIIIVPVACYWHFKEIDSEIWETAWEIENINREINKIK
jgi:hypothetical protein